MGLSFLMVHLQHDSFMMLLFIFVCLHVPKVEGMHTVTRWAHEGVAPDLHGCRQTEDHCASMVLQCLAIDMPDCLECNLGGACHATLDRMSR